MGRCKGIQVIHKWKALIESREKPDFMRVCAA